MEFRINSKSSFFSWLIFLPTFIAVLISIIPAVFPALVLRALGGFDDEIGINPFETGIWTFPLLVTNFILLGLSFLYFKNKLPKKLTDSFRFIFNFEIPPQIAFFVVTILIGFYILFSVGELVDGYFQDDFKVHFEAWLKNYSVTEIPEAGIGYQVPFFLETTSMKIFENYKVIPFIASISLLILTYFFTTKITKKRFAGIVSMVIVMQSNIFLMYDTSVTYPNFWILFYLLSLYLVYIKWPLSPISWVASAMSKLLLVPFLPFSMFFIYRSDISKKTKLRVLIFYLIIAVLGIIFIFYTGMDIVGGELEFNSHDFWGGFTTAYLALRFDGLVLIFLLPLTLGLFFAARKGIVHADSMMLLILAMLLSAPLMQGLSDFIIVPYRFIPLITFFAIGVGVLLSKNFNVKS